MTCLFGAGTALFGIEWDLLTGARKSVSSTAPRVIAGRVRLTGRVSLTHGCRLPPLPRPGLPLRLSGLTADVGYVTVW